MEQLTDKQIRFCHEYIIDSNATQAAIRAGYSLRTAYRTGCDNLKKRQIRACIDELVAQIESKKIADASEVMRYLTSVMRDEVEEDTVVVENIGDYMSEARIIRKKIGGREKVKAAELLAKRYSLFTERDTANEEALGKLDKILEGVNKVMAND